MGIELVIDEGLIGIRFFNEESFSGFLIGILFPIVFWKSKGNNQEEENEEEEEEEGLITLKPDESVLLAFPTFFELSYTKSINLISISAALLGLGLTFQVQGKV